MLTHPQGDRAAGGGVVAMLDVSPNGIIKNGPHGAMDTKTALPYQPDRRQPGYF